MSFTPDTTERSFFFQTFKRMEQMNSKLLEKNIVFPSLKPIIKDGIFWWKYIEDKN